MIPLIAFDCFANVRENPSRPNEARIDTRADLSDSTLLGSSDEYDMNMDQYMCQRLTFVNRDLLDTPEWSATSSHGQRERRCNITTRQTSQYSTTKACHQNHHWLCEHFMYQHGVSQDLQDL